MPKKKAVICIVDDDESVREAMKSLMESLGLHAEVFGSAEKFLASNMTDRTACLIADMQMPGLTGLSLHERLVASGHNVPTILITAYPDERTRARAQRAGILSYLSKPFAENDLLTIIRSVMDRNGEP
jgi:FixJ family two-component response regulator